MTTIRTLLGALGLGLVVAATGAAAQEHSAAEPTHFPIHKPRTQSWSTAQLALRMD